MTIIFGLMIQFFKYMDLTEDSLFTEKLWYMDKYLQANLNHSGGSVLTLYGMTISTSDLPKS